jgi:polyhydroxyalkanoate synthase
MSATGAAAASRELAELGQRLAQAARELAQLRPVKVGSTPREPVWSDGKRILWRYGPTVKGGRRPPLLIVYALVNRPYMLDLQPDRSLIAALVAAGHSVYLLDWGTPDRADRALSLADYVLGFLDQCVARVRAASGARSVDLLGVCQGGTLALCYTALEPKQVRRLALMVTPVDFHTRDNLLARFVRDIDVELLVRTYGNVPGELLNAAFLALKPLRLSVQKYLSLADLAGDREALANFLRMEQWIFDSPDQAGAAFREFVQWFYQQNRLVQGTLVLGGRPVCLKSVTCPVLNVYALQDHLVPPSASLPLASAVGSRRYRTWAFDGGHIGIYVSARAQRQLPATLSGWLGEAL